MQREIRTEDGDLAAPSMRRQAGDGSQTLSSVDGFCQFWSLTEGFLLEFLAGFAQRLFCKFTACKPTSTSRLFNPCSAHQPFSNTDSLLDPSWPPFWTPPTLRYRYNITPPNISLYGNGMSN